MPFADAVYCGVPISVTRAYIGAVGLWSSSAVCTWDGETLHVLEALYSFTADFHFRLGFLEPVHKSWPYDDVIYACEAYFYPSGLPGVCAWTSALWKASPGTALVFAIDYGLPHDNLQIFDIPQVPSSGIYDNVLPDPA